MNAINANAERNRGLMAALAAYITWGVVPIYFKLLQSLPEAEILVHRVIWSLLFTGATVIYLRRGAKIKSLFSSKKSLLVLAGSSFFIGSNWILFIWGSNNDHLIEVSLGYYINPLMNVAMGMIFFRERLRKLQWVALLLAFIGVLVQVIFLGKLPILSLGLALAWGSYGLIRKLQPTNSLDGLLAETLFMLLPAIVYLLFFSDLSSIKSITDTPYLFLLLVLSGPITSIPLILFSIGVKRLKYSTIGFIQYVAPSIALGLAVFVYHEPLVWQKALTFIFIWLALGLFTADSLYASRNNRLSLRPNSQT